MGWHEQEKKAELFDPMLSRFILVRTQTKGPGGEAGPGVNEVSSIAAFSMFRFEFDQGERLLYW